MKSLHLRIDKRVAFVYALFGFLWILLSDRLLAAFVPGPSSLTAMQTYKGTAYVLVSALLIYTLLRRDLQIRQSAEAELRASEARHRQLFETSMDAILLTAPDGSIYSANPAACRMFGRSEEELRQVGRDGVVDVEDARLEAALEERRRTGSFQGELTFRRKDGARFPVEISSNVYTTEDGFERASMIIRDISQRKAYEEQLRDSEQRYRQLFEANPNVMWVYERASQAFLAVNEAMLQHYGYSRDEFRTMNVADLHGAEDRNAVWENMHHLPGPLRKAGVWQHRKKDGALITVEITTHDLEFDGRPARLVLANDISERLRAELKIQEQVDRLTALREIDQAITSTFDMRISLNTLLSRATALLGVEAGAVFLLDPVMNNLKFIAGMGFRTSAIRSARLKLGDSFAGQAILDRRIVQIPNLAQETRQTPLGDLLRRESFVSYFGTPLIVKGEVIGVLEVFHREPLQPDTEWLNFLDTLAGQAAIAIDNLQMFNNLQQSNIRLVLAYDATIEGWSRALDLRDKETEGHTQRVTELTERLARVMGIHESELVHIRRGALLHDIGKMGIPDAILLKPDKLDTEEWAIMHRHPTFAYELLAPIEYLRPALDIPYCHHEKWDGSGYPRGLKGEQIPQAARIFAVVDVWDALCSDRPYRHGWPIEQVRAYIREQSGAHFDPRVAEQFLRLEAGLL